MFIITKSRQRKNLKSGPNKKSKKQSRGRVDLASDTAKADPFRKWQSRGRVDFNVSTSCPNGGRVEAESIPMCGHHVPTVAESRQSQIPLVDTKFRGGRVEAESISKVAESKQSRFLWVDTKSQGGRVEAESISK